MESYREYTLSNLTQLTLRNNRFGESEVNSGSWVGTNLIRPMDLLKSLETNSKGIHYTQSQILQRIIKL